MIPILVLTAALIVDPNPQVKLTHLEDQSFQIDAAFVTEAKSSVIFNTLTDYEHHPDFLHAIKKVVQVQSIQQSPNITTKIIDEVISERVLIFTKTVHVRLEVLEMPDKQRIEFRDILGEDFSKYEGYWQITSQNGQQVVSHHIVFKPTFNVPNWLVNRLFKKDSRKLLDEVQEEIIKRTLTLEIYKTLLDILKGLQVPK